MNQRRPKPAPPKAAPAKPAPPKPSAPKTDWSAVADWYDDLVGDNGSEYHQAVVIPGVVRLLGLGKGQSALDVACGQGVLCRRLLADGISVTGVDAAKELIGAARERGPAEIQYLIGDVRKLDFVPADRFDGAACVLGLDNINPLDTVFSGVASSLKVGGCFVMVMMHPCFRGPKESSWGWDDKAAVQYRRVDRYLLPRKAPIVTHPGDAQQGYTWTFHRPISAYVKWLSSAGLPVDAMEEWTSHKESTSGPRAAAENRARKEIPMFLSLRGRKIR
jgi:ubiquinone/menaquinone biosynthesis C-methylase UbiE